MKKTISIIALILVLGIIWMLMKKERTIAPITNEISETSNAALLATNPNTSIIAEEVLYYGNVKGYYVRPELQGKNIVQPPGVIMVHEWWGLNQQIKDMAVTLAKDGYQVLAVDLYGGKIATTREEAQQYRTETTPEEAVKNLQAARNFLQNKDALKIASLGWCYGGGKSLELALSGVPLNATVIYYGTLTDDKQKLQKIRWPVLGIFGDQDQSISVDSVKKFETALNSLGIQNEIHIYPGVGHAFANPSGASYAAKETRDAWEKTKAFLAAALK